MWRDPFLNPTLSLGSTRQVERQALFNPLNSNTLSLNILQLCADNHF